MKRTSRIFSTALMLFLLAFTVAAAVFADETDRKLWNRMCASCHDGSTAPDEAALRTTYPTIDVFTEAVRSKGNRCMNILKNDPKLISQIGAELGIGD